MKKSQKITAVIALFVMMVFAMQTVAMAAALEIDTTSPDFKCDAWQNYVDNGEVFPLINAVTKGHSRNGSFDDVVRYSVSVKTDYEYNEGAPVNYNGTGAAAVNIYIPFKETVKLDSFEIKWNKGDQTMFFLAFTSTDMQNWTEVNITSSATKVKLEQTYGMDGETTGPSIEAYMHDMAGFDAEDDVNTLTFNVGNPVEAKYFRLVGFGRDGGGNPSVTSDWFSFNGLAFNGSVVQAAAVVEAAPAATVEQSPAVVEAPASQPVTAPQTGDSTFIFVILAAAACAAFTRIRSKSHR